jgi:hypothetical protein
MVAVLLGLAALTGLVAGCGGGGGGFSQEDQQFLSSVHVSAPDIGTYRTDSQLTRIGHAVCADFQAGASYEEVADRMPLVEGNNPLPSEDLGAVIDAAVQSYCPAFSGRV